MKAIAAKLMAASRACRYLEKTSKTPQYRFVPWTAYAERVNEVLGQQGLAVVKTTMEVLGESDPPGRTATVRISITVCDVDSGECASFEGVGAMIDAGGGGGKAVAMAASDAYKKLWTVAFSIATGEAEPETFAEEATVKAVRYDLGLASEPPEVLAVALEYRERISGLSERHRTAAKTSLTSALRRVGKDGAWLAAELARVDREAGQANEGAP